MSDCDNPKVIILMGVSGSGKTTIGRLLAEELGWSFYEGDRLHPPENVAKMRQGQPLTDQDRIPWLVAVHDLIRRLLTTNEPAVITCSALKESYREQIMRDNEAACLIYLRGDYDLILNRLQNRQDHFMPADLLASQFATLEEPDDLFTVDVEATPKAIVETIKQEVEQVDRA